MPAPLDENILLRHIGSLFRRTILKISNETKTTMLSEAQVRMLSAMANSLIKIKAARKTSQEYEKLRKMDNKTLIENAKKALENKANGQINDEEFDDKILPNRND